jgi:FKBP-type peptidyl-prolyl cis-trans isomerase SlpA
MAGAAPPMTDPTAQAQHSPSDPRHAPARIQAGARVRLHLALYLEDGTEVLGTFDDAPLAFRMGDGTLAPGLESMLLDLPVGAEVTLLAEGAAIYGPVDPELVHDMPRSDLSADTEYRPGQVIAFATPGGQETSGTVIAVAEQHVRVDFNHPLARRGLRIQVQVLAVD